MCVYTHTHTHIYTLHNFMLCLIFQKLNVHKNIYIYWLILHQKYVIINIVFNFNAKDYNITF